MEIHFLNVGAGDCSIIEHDSGRISMIDICCGNPINALAFFGENDKGKSASAEANHVCGNFHQSEHPENPIAWLGEELFRNPDSRFSRFILTHPDMDHMDGLDALFKAHKPPVFWDTDNNAKKDTTSSFGRYRKEDWTFYQKLHEAGKSCGGVQILKLHEGKTGRYYNRDDEDGDGDRITILSPDKQTTHDANAAQDMNELSYVLLVKSMQGRKFVFAGDSDKTAWERIMAKYAKDLTDIDVLFAPHHGRKSGGCREYLKVLNPKVTFFGNADKNLDHPGWNNKGLLKFTNNQAGSIVITETGPLLEVFATNRKFVAAFLKEREENVKPHYEKRGGKSIYWLTEIW